MKKLFIPLLITMTGLASNSAFAQEATVTKPGASGFVTVEKDGVTYTGTELDQTTAEKYLTEICGLFKVNDTWQFTNESGNYVAPQNAGDVFFVEVNDYWYGLKQSGNNMYDQISKGVKKITAVDTNSSQQTSSGTFYTHPATDANKFFFIARNNDSYAPRVSGPYYNYAFGWYDEWSYVENPDVNGDAGWEALESNWETLMDGAPFPSPHNCNSSLENNHYVALDGKLPTDRVGHDFTAYLYIPKIVYEIVNNNKTYYIFTKIPYEQYKDWFLSTNLLTDVYVKDTNSDYVSIAQKYPDQFYIDFYWEDVSEQGTEEGTTYKYRKDANLITEECPYVFFYNVDLNKVQDDDVKEKAEGSYDPANQNKYNVILHWSTAFDKFASNAVQANTQYDTMQEHYIIERSYDNDTWEIVSNDIIVSGNDVRSADGKTITDTGLKAFDENTAQFGYTVWYRVTSIVEKDDDNGNGDGTDMSRTTSNVVRVEIPGTVPFKLTLEGKGTSVYDPVNETNTFTNTIISSYSKVENDEVKAGSTLSLYRVDAKDKIIVDDESPLITVTAKEGETLADLAKQIDNQNGENPAGEFKDIATLDAGDGNEAAYQLVMTIPDYDTPVYSNILRISNAAIANGSFAAHRSGYPDAETCKNGNPEIFHNEITFKASANRVGTGYYIYRRYNKEDPEMIMTLIYNGEDGFRVDGSTDNTPIKPDPTTGEITIIDIVDTAPIAEGEGKEPDENVKVTAEAAWSYAVAYSDNVGNENNENTYGSESKRAEYFGTQGELVLEVEADIKAANFSQPGNWDIYTEVTIAWNRTKEYDDTKPSFYEIYLKKNGNDRTDITDPKFVKIKTFDAEANINTYTFTETYESEWQRYNEQKYDLDDDITKELFENSLKDAYEVYVKMITTEGKEKNSFIAIPETAAGTNIFTGIEGVEAQEIDVKVVNGVVEVSGVNGLINVSSTKFN